MRTVSVRPIARAGLALLALAFVPARAAAQPSRFRISPSLSVVQMYDDNLFYTPTAREPDNIWRLSPRLGFSRRSARFTLDARYGQDAEFFRRHPALNRADARQDGALSLGWTVTRRLDVAAGASYEEAQAPGQLNTVTGLEVGRFRARRLSETASLASRLGARTKLTLEQGFIREEMAGGVGSDTQTGSLRMERRWGPVDRGRVSYSVRRFAFGQVAELAHIVTLGWSRQVTSLTHFEFEAGPRLSGRAVGVEVSTGLRHRFQQGEASLAYLRTQTTVLGQPGPITADGVTATFSRRLPGRLRVAGGPSVFEVQSRGSEATIYRLSLEVAWPLTRGLSLIASHHFNLQRGGLGPGSRPDEEVTHNTVLLNVAAASVGNRGAGN